jgi:hypothetical protein
VVISLLEVTTPSAYNQLSTVGNLLLIPADILGWIEPVIFFVWIHLIHADLRDVLGYYPITPGGAVVRYLVPIYNVWGIWNTLSTFANTFQHEGGNLTRMAEKVRSLIPWLYLFMTIYLVSIFLAVTSIIGKTVNPTIGVSPLLLVFVAAISLGGTIVDLLLVLTMTQAIAQKAKRENALA